jgi:hypothetical protein
VSIRDSYNVSSITDVTTGTYHVHFINNLVNDNYSLVTSCSGTQYGDAGFVNQDGTVGYIVVYSYNPNGLSSSYVDSPTCCALVFGD